MGRWVIGVITSLLLWPGGSAADSSSDDIPIAKPAPANASWYGNAPPTAVPEPPAYIRRIERGGPFVLGGLSLGSGATFARVDFGLPVALKRARRLRALLISEFRYDSIPSGTETISARNLSVTPGLQYDWSLPSSSLRDFIVIAGAGLMWSRTWVRRPDEPYWPSMWESSTAYAGRLEVGLQYRRTSGLILSLPLGVLLPLNTPAPPDARWMVEQPETTFTLSLLAGYQFR